MEPQAAPPPPPPGPVPAPTAPPAGPAPVPAAAKQKWPTPAKIAVGLVALFAVLGILVGQLQVKNANDRNDTLNERLTAAEDDADSGAGKADELQKQVDDLTAQNQQLTGENQQLADSATKSAAELVTAQQTAADQATKITDLTGQLAAAQSNASQVGGVFPVGLEDLKKVNLSATSMPLTSKVVDCTYAKSTCDYLGSAKLDADVYQDKGQWILTMRADGVPYFQAALALDATGSFVGSEYINAEGTCGSAAVKPFATVYVNPVEFTVADNQLKGTRFRGYLKDSTDCGESNFTFEGRTG